MGEPQAKALHGDRIPHGHRALLTPEEIAPVVGSPVGEGTGKAL
jgi:hypothetical protein